MIKGIRKSFKGDKRSSSGSSKSQSNSANGSIPRQMPGLGSSTLDAVTPPKKIIKAIYDYQAQRPGELSFSRGDFLYVTGNEDSDTWYDACDPPSQLQGVVPATYFEVVSRQDTIPTVPIAELMNSINRNGTVKSNTDIGGTTSSIASSSSTTSTRPKPTMAIYGIVLYDFDAERPDELQAKTSDAIIIIAQSNEEWFVAKPIGKLGGPGLIPISYVELREVGSDKPVDDPQDAIRKAGIPKVEEWKRLAAEYKASSISLGKFEDDTASISRQMQQMAIREQHIQHQQQLQRLSQATGGTSTAAAATGGASSSRAASQVGSQYHRYSDNFNSNGIMNGNMNGNRTSGTGTAATSRVTSSGALSSGRLSAKSMTRAVSSSGSSSPVYVVGASVDRYAFHAGRYWYLLVAEMSNGKHRNLCRYYQDFYDFQIKLLDEFPEEAGRTGKERLLPYMPGPLTYVNDSISSQRRVNLDEYVHKLVALPEYISRSAFVLQLFDIRPGDVETADVSSTMPEPNKELEHEVVQMRDESSSTTLQAPVDQLSHTRVDSQNTLTEPKPDAPQSVQQTQQITQQYPQHSRTSAGADELLGAKQTAEQLKEVSPSTHANGVNGTNGNRTDLANGHGVNGVNGHGTNGNGNGPYTHRFTGSTATNGSHKSNKSMSNGSPAFVKVKVFYNDDLIAIRFPSDATFDSLKLKICERLQLNAVKLMHRVDSTSSFAEITDEEEFQSAVRGKAKLVFHAVSI